MVGSWTPRQSFARFPARGGVFFFLLTSPFIEPQGGLVRLGSPHNRIGLARWRSDRLVVASFGISDTGIHRHERQSCILQQKRLNFCIFNGAFRPCYWNQRRNAAGVRCRVLHPLTLLSHISIKVQAFRRSSRPDLALASVILESNEDVESYRIPQPNFVPDGARAELPRESWKGEHSRETNPRRA